MMAATEQEASNVALLAAAVQQACAEDDSDELDKLLEAANCLYTETGRWTGPADEAEPFPVLVLFECLALPATVHGAECPWLNVCCVLLEKTLHAIEPAGIVSQHMKELQAGLSHPASRVRQLSLRQVVRLVQDTQGTWVHDLVQERMLLDAVVTALGDSELAVAAVANKALQLLAATGEGLDYLLEAATVDKLQTLAAGNAATSVRVCDCWVGIAAQSQETHSRLSKAGMLEPLYAAVAQTDDLLLRISSMEIFAQLAATSFGLDELVTRGLIKTVLSPLSPGADGLEGALLLEPSVEFVCSLASSSANNGCDLAALNDKVPFFDTIKQMAAEGSGIAQIQALNALGLVVRAATGLRLVATETGVDALGIAALRRGIFQTGNRDLHAQALHAAANCFDGSLDTSPQQARAAVFHSLNAGATLLDTALDSAKCQLEDKRQAGFHCLHTLSRQPWGREALVAYPGFVEWLVDRKLGFGYELEQLRHAIAREVTAHPCPGLAAQLLENMREYVRAGPFAARPGVLNPEFEVAREAA
eukprot:m.52665 g.52665  ORF g.52665 m.52665 type:complete len:534 (+) comp12318_c0_seq1:152-1753(+)